MPDGLFPCFDEPHLKATFSVSVGRHKDQVSCSNAADLALGLPMEGSQEYVWDHYEQSVAMSTYLVAIMVSNYSYTEAFTRQGMSYKTWYTKKKLNQTQHSTKAGVKIMDYLQQNIFRLSYPLPKMDQVAVPRFRSDSGAMENWGMMTFRLERILDSPDNTKGKYYIDWLISHELVHQWIGNIVTMAWWNDTWLNEGVTSYLQYHGLLALYPEDFVWQSLSAERYLAFDEDYQPNTDYPHHVVTAMKEKWIQSPSDIDRIIYGFNIFRYYRGASIVAMVVNMVGLQTFLDAINAYLVDKAFGAAITDDLWSHLDTTTRANGFFSDKPTLTIKKIMNPWVIKPGFPILTLIRNYTTGGVTAYQRSNQRSGLHSSSFWHIWLTCYSPTTNTSASQLLLPVRSQKLDLPIIAKDEALVCNRGQHGYFRLRYDVRNLRKIAAVMLKNHTALAALERAQVILDTAPLEWPLSLPNCHPCTVTAWWRMMNYLKNERNVMPWRKAMKKLDQILGYLKSSPTSVVTTSPFVPLTSPPAAPSIHKRFIAWTTSLVEPYIAANQGFEMPQHATEEEMKVHNLVVGFACNTLQHAACTDFAQKQLFSWLDSSSGKNPIHPMIRLPLLERALRTIKKRTKEVKNFILAQSETAKKTENFNQHQINLLNKLIQVIKNNPLIYGLMPNSIEAGRVLSKNDFLNIHKSFDTHESLARCSNDACGETEGRTDQGGGRQGTLAGGVVDNTPHCVAMLVARLEPLLSEFGF